MESHSNMPDGFYSSGDAEQVTFTIEQLVESIRLDVLAECGLPPIQASIVAHRAVQVVCMAQEEGLLSSDEKRIADLAQLCAIASVATLKDVAKGRSTQGEVPAQQNPFGKCTLGGLACCNVQLELLAA